jgi:cbb3-type cytochrome oxidase cytochrome c subunit
MTPDLTDLIARLKLWSTRLPREKREPYTQELIDEAAAALEAQAKEIERLRYSLAKVRAENSGLVQSLKDSADFLRRAGAERDALRQDAERK